MLSCERVLGEVDVRDTEVEEGSNETWVEGEGFVVV